MPRTKNDIALTMTNAGMEMDAEYDSESDEDYNNKRAKGGKKAKPAIRRKTQRWAVDSEEDEDDDEGLRKRRSKKKKEEDAVGRRGGRAEAASRKRSSEKSEKLHGNGDDCQGSKMKGRRGSKKEKEEEKKEHKGLGKGEREKGHDKKEKGDTSSSFSSSDSDSESLSEGELAELQEEVEEKKKLMNTLRSKPWHMKRKLRSLKKSLEFVEAFETMMGKVKGTNIYTLKAMINKKLTNVNREFANLKAMMTPWQEKIKEIESHYGSSVASYFIFLRWTFIISLIPFGLVTGLIIIPEALWGAPYGTIPRKTIPRNEQASALDFDILYEFGGYLKYSTFFYGYYDNKEKLGFFEYQLPLAYLLVGLIIFLYSLVVVIRVMAKHADESGSIGDEDAFHFSWKVFTSWEYLVGNTETAEEKSAAITLGFKESLVDDLRHFKNESLYKRLFLRFVANMLILASLAGSGYLIYFVTKRQQLFSKMDRTQVSWIQKNEVEIVISLLGMFCPPLFEYIAELEDYHPRIALRWQLGRLFTLFVGNIYTFVFAVIENTTEQLQVEMIIRNESAFVLQQYYANYTLYHNVTENIPPPDIAPADAIRGPCWETEVGIEFMKLIVSDMEVTYITLLISDTARGVIVRYLNYCWCWDLEATFPSYAQFDISGSVLGIIFNQGMVLMGTLYCPALVSVNIIRLVSTMYFQCWVLKSSNIPSKKLFQASRINTIYMGILLFVLFFCLIPVIIMIMTMSPSFDCGPFSGKNRMYDVFTDVILEMPPFIKTAISYVFNPGVIMSIVIFMMLAIYYLQKVSIGYHKTNLELKKRLDKEKERNKNYSSNKLKKDEKDVMNPEFTAEEPSNPYLDCKLPMVNEITDEATNGTGVHLENDMSLAAEDPWSSLTRPLIPRCPGPLPGYGHLLPPGLLKGRMGPPPVI